MASGKSSCSHWQLGDQTRHTRVIDGTFSLLGFCCGHVHVIFKILSFAGLRGQLMMFYYRCLVSQFSKFPMLPPSGLAAGKQQAWDF
jgi:hypothetical protein